MTAYERYLSWLNNDQMDNGTRIDLAGLTPEAVEDRFYQELEFGTAGLRGVMGSGTNRMNEYVVRRASAGLAAWLNQQGTGARGVVIAWDTRNSSRLFARAAACTLAAAGVPAYLFEVPSATPVLSFAVPFLDAAAGIVVTASHNQAPYNGFKVYDATGCQLPPEAAALVAKKMEDCSYTPPILPEDQARDRGLLRTAGEDVFEAFLDAAAKQARPLDNAAKAALNIVYTPLHGTGANLVPRLLEREDYTGLVLVEAQMTPDGRFPTVKTPNPEEPEAMAMAISQAVDSGADLVLATDPDCDRICAAIPAPEGFRQLTGAQLGGLLLAYLADQTNWDQSAQQPIVITTVVTGNLGPVLAQARGLELRRVLTGFKYIGEQLNNMTPQEKDRYVLGYEESCGYLVGLHARDKDAAAAALVLCEMAARCKARGETLLDVLTGLYQTYGWQSETTRSAVFPGQDGSKQMKQIMANLRTGAAKDLPGLTQTLDYGPGLDGLPPTDLMKFLFSDGSWAAVRPSGTEPKLKLYVSGTGRTEDEAQSRRQDLLDRFSRIMGL